ncbi:Uncharacterised protein [Niallia circulans]|nr:DUF1827 family protein [Niallia circulans]MED4243143.1 DUF1827 family protein [Niallia circulans]SPU10947.1 Uncharacterised protein [Niallia circulans]
MNFKDITHESDEVIVVANGGDISLDTRVFKNKDTHIIYSSNAFREHLSISNPYRSIKTSEINYALFRIMKSKFKDVEIFKSTKGIIHIYKQMI